MVLTGKTEEMRPIGRSWRRCEDNVKCIFRKYDGSVWMDLICLAQDSDVVNLGSIKCREFLEQLKNYFLLKKNFAPVELGSWCAYKILISGSNGKQRLRAHCCLLYTLPKCYRKISYHGFPRCHHALGYVRTLQSAASLSLPPHKFNYSPCCYGL